MMNSSIFTTPVIALFIFHFQFVSDKLGCPLPGLTVVTKELFLSLKVITVTAFLLPIYAAHRIVNKSRHRDNLRRQQTLCIAVSKEILLRLREVCFRDACFPTVQVDTGDDLTTDGQ